MAAHLERLNQAHQAKQTNQAGQRKTATAGTMLAPTHKADTFTFEQLPLQRGGFFGPITLAYETWGTLNAEGDNAILITHALTGSAHAHDV